VPVSETALLAPVNPYGVSKAAVDLMGYQYYKSFGIPVYRIRAFSHTGPDNRPRPFCPIGPNKLPDRTGKAPAEIKVGNLKVIRDLFGCRRRCSAYESIFEKGRPGEAYNVCSGIGHQLDILLEIIIGFSSKKIAIKDRP